MQHVNSMLRNWLRDPATTVRLAPAGYSGAQIWHVVTAEGQFALKCWGPDSVTAAKLQAVQQFQSHLAARLPFIAAIRPTADGAGSVESQNRFWSLETWMTGYGDFKANPSDVRLEAAMRALALAHLEAAKFRNCPQRIGLSPSLEHRRRRLELLLGGELTDLRRIASTAPLSERALAESSYELIARLLPRIEAEVAPFGRIELPMHWRIGDVREEHILFTADAVTGLIDFGAATVDAPIADVARLVGTAVGDDAARRRLALAAYHDVRPISPTERSALDVFDASGVVLAACNWIRWLWASPPAPAARGPIRPGALGRLEHLNSRMAAAVMQA